MASVQTTTATHGSSEQSAEALGNNASGGQIAVGDGSDCLRRLHSHAREVFANLPVIIAGMVQASMREAEEHRLAALIEQDRKHFSEQRAEDLYKLASPSWKKRYLAGRLKAEKQARAAHARAIRQERLAVAKASGKVAV